MLPERFVRTLLFRPTVFLIHAGIAIVALAETSIGRFTIRPFFRIFCRWILYARPLIFLRGKSQHVMQTEEILDILEHRQVIAVIPCACRTGKPPCAHPLHTPHEINSCIAFGLAAILQIGSGLGRRINAQEARAIFEQATDSGLVHHIIYSMGEILEICNCCPETCAAIKTYKSGIPEALRPSDYVATRTSRCNGCSHRSGRICVKICPYGKEPSRAQCFGCGLCARYCPQQAIRMILRKTKLGS